jgi:hypothetical protein
MRPRGVQARVPKKEMCTTEWQTSDGKSAENSFLFSAVRGRGR